LTLGRSAKLAASTVNVFSAPEAGNEKDSDNEAETISLRHSRHFTSLPVLFTSPVPSEQLILPLLPLADIQHHRFCGPVEASAGLPPTMIVGADPESMNSFLGFFTH
jgi:hypothetical protein